MHHIFGYLSSVSLPTPRWPDYCHTCQTVWSYFWFNEPRFAVELLFTSGGTIKIVQSLRGQWSNTFGFEICKSIIHGCNIHTSTLAGSETVAGRNAIIIVGWSAIAPVEISPLEVKVLPPRVEMPLQQEDALSLHHLFWWKRYHRACSDIWIISAERKRRCTAYENNF